MRTFLTTIILMLLMPAALPARETADTMAVASEVVEVVTVDGNRPIQTLTLDTTFISTLRPLQRKGDPVNIYTLPYSRTLRSENWHRMWLNTAVYAGAFVGTLFVLECLPEDATAWNRAELRKDPPQKRWFKNVFKRGPEWDHDNPIFNYVLHPYAGAVYFMSARSNGFSYYGSLLYAACISTIGWEFGIEACMERPSYQDIFVTPLVGSVIGELFFKLKRHIVANDYRLFGSPVLGNIVAFFIDPVNEIFGYFGGNDTRKLHLGKKHEVTSVFMPNITSKSVGFAFVCTF